MKQMSRSVGVLISIALMAGVSLPSVAQSPEKTNSTPSRSTSRAQAQPEIEKQRKAAEQQAQRSLDKEAVAAIQETERALKLIGEGKTSEAVSALERANGKIAILTARQPAAALLPVAAEVEVIETAPLAVTSIRLLADAAEQAVEDRDFPAARTFLAGLISEIRVRTHHLPLATYPAAMKEAARLMDQKRTAEATVVLRTALSTLAIIDRVTPLPLVLAQVALEEAQTQRSSDREQALKMLEVAELELDRAKELGYSGKDPGYQTLDGAISELKGQLNGRQDTVSAFTALKQQLSSFFSRLVGNEKSGEPKPVARAK